MTWSRWLAVASVAGALLTVGCEQKSRSTPAPAPSVAEPAEAAESPPAPRSQKVDLALTPERRTKIERAIPEARGFLVAAEIEQRLQQDKEVDRREVAAEKFDQAAKGRWVLFTGGMLERQGQGFALPVTYLAGSRRDKMRVTPSWFLVRFENVQGYSSVLTRDGMETAVLAKYRGADEPAAPAIDLVGRRLW